MSKETAEQFIAALGRLEAGRDLAPIVSLFADDCEVGNVVTPEPFRGRDGAREFWGAKYRDTFEYTVLRADRLKVVNSCRKKDGRVSSAEGVARLADSKGANSRLKVRFAPGFLSFLPVVWGDYQVIELAPDYSHALVGEPGRKYLWILSRTPRMDEAAYRRLAKRAASEGFDVSKLLRVSHE